MQKSLSKKHAAVAERTCLHHLNKFDERRLQLEQAYDRWDILDMLKHWKSSLDWLTQLIKSSHKLIALGVDTAENTELNRHIMNYKNWINEIMTFCEDFLKKREGEEIRWKMLKFGWVQIKEEWKSHLSQKSFMIYDIEEKPYILLIGSLDDELILLPFNQYVSFFAKWDDEKMEIQSKEFVTGRLIDSWYTEVINIKPDIFIDIHNSRRCKNATNF